MNETKAQNGSTDENINENVSWRGQIVGIPPSVPSKNTTSVKPSACSLDLAASWRLHEATAPKNSQTTSDSMRDAKTWYQQLHSRMR